MDSNTHDHTAIVLFDGVCNFCNSSVNFIIRHDKKAHFKFASLQSEIGKALCEKFEIDVQRIDSIILIENDQFNIKSSAILRITKKLNGGYPLLFGFIIIPRFVRDVVYDLIARNRYKWFGKKESCMIPTPDVKERFIS
ncbi:MAG: thiol-disulfide oxidoreductase DCC family protein [Bacteroidia bacterium]|nr:thiol-disulfide oxidoreductase DCC family protein [Bacteroidia bacterium]